MESWGGGETDAFPAKAAAYIGDDFRRTAHYMDFRGARRGVHPRGVCRPGDCAGNPCGLNYARQGADWKLNGRNLPENYFRCATNKRSLKITTGIIASLAKDSILFAIGKGSFFSLRLTE